MWYGKKQIFNPLIGNKYQTSINGIQVFNRHLICKTLLKEQSVSAVRLIRFKLENINSLKTHSSQKMVEQKLLNLNSIVAIKKMKYKQWLNSYFEMHQLDVMIQQQFVPSAERGVIWTCSRMPDFVYINNLSASTRQCRIPNLNYGKHWVFLPNTKQ